MPGIADASHNYDAANMWQTRCEQGQLMTLNRRQWLQGISYAGAIGATGKASAFASSPGRSQASFSPASSLPMPRDLGSPVTPSLRPVIEASQDVHTHYEKIVEVAGWMAYEDLPLPNLAIPYGLEKTPDIAMDFVMVANTIDTAFTDFKTHVKFQIDYASAHLSDSGGQVPGHDHAARHGQDFRGEYGNAHGRGKDCRVSRSGQGADGKIRRPLPQLHPVVPDAALRQWQRTGGKACGGVPAL